MEAIFLENYFIKNEIGRGNISIVYRAVNSKTNEEVALKRFFLPHILLESQRKVTYEKSQDELGKIIELEFPGILDVRSFFEEDNNFYLEMELLKGKTIAQINDEGTRLKLDEGAHIFLKCAEALCYAHRKGILHRYLKPSNIFITEDGEIKITDFGTHMFNRDYKNRDIAKERIPPKVIKYFSPEQLENDECDVRSDIYSLAAVMYELFTGKPPFVGESRELLENAILEEEVESPRFLNPNIPELLDYLIVKALNRDPDLRHRDMDELIRDIQHLFQSGHLENTGIRAGHIRKVQGRVAQKVHHVKKGMWDLFKKITPAEEEEVEETAPDSGVLRKHRRRRKSSDGLEISAPVLEKSVPGQIPMRQKPVTGTKRKIKKSKKDKKPDKSSKILKGVIVSVLILILIIFAVIMAVKVIKSKKTVDDLASANSHGTPTPVVAKKSGRNGTVVITCNTSEVHIFMQNYYNRNMPPIEKKTGAAGQAVEIETPAGVYSLRLAKEMYRPYEARIEVMVGQRKTVKANLEKKEPRLQIITNPGGASVYLNHSFYGKTPLTLYDIRYGKYKLNIRKKNYNDLESDINIRSGEPLIINKELEKKLAPDNSVKKEEKKKTFISIFTVPAGATIYIDEKKIGYSPIKKLPHPPGKYTLNIQMAGYRTINREINIPEGFVRDFFIDMAKIQETASNTKEEPPDYTDPVPQSPTPKKTKHPVIKPEVKKPDQLKLMVRLIFTDGIAYDKLNRKAIDISFDKQLIASKIERALEGERDIIITDSIPETDVLMKVHFAVGVNTQSSSTKPDLTLYSAVMVTGIDPKRTLYYVHDNSPLPFPTEASVNSTGGGFSSSRLVDRENGTREANAFLEEHIGRVLNVLREYRLKMEI